jgi:hypothetical protein
VLEWLDDAGNVVVAQRVIAGPAVNLGEPPQGAATFRLRGLAFLGADGQWGIAPASGAPVTSVTVDGAEVYTARGVAPVERPVVQIRGWHLIDVQGTAADNVAFTLEWRSGTGSAGAIAPEQLFALADTPQLWRHERTYRLPEDGGEFTALRYDLNPHYAAFDGMKVEAATSLPFGTRALNERWSGTMTVEQAATYRVFLSAFRQRFTLLIDGQNPLGAENAPTDQAFIDVPLAAGDHTISLEFEPVAEDVVLIGGQLGFSKSDTGEEVRFPVRPY